MQTKNMNVASPYVSGIAALILGTVMVAWPNEVLVSVITIVGWFLVIIGATPMVYSLVKQYPVSYMSVTFFVSGVLLLFFGGFFMSLLMWILGFILIFGSIHQFNQLSVARQMGYTPRSYSYFSPVILLLAGVITIFNPFNSMAVLVTFFGASLLFYGISLLINQMLLQKKN